MSKKQAHVEVVAATAIAPIIEQPKVESNPAKPTQTQSQRDAILDALAGKVLRNERLPRRITVGGEEIDTSVFLVGYSHDRRSASGMLGRLAPECFVGTALTSECAAQIGFALETQLAKRAQAPTAKAEQRPTL